MSDSITEQLQEAQTALEAVHSVAELSGVETRFLGRDKGLNELRRGIRSLPAEERPAFGARINEAVAALTERIAARRVALQAQEMEARLAAEALDVTLPGRPLPAGRPHPDGQGGAR